MKTKLITAILTLITFVSVSSTGYAEDPPKIKQNETSAEEVLHRPRMDCYQGVTLEGLFVVYILDGCGQVIDVYITSIDNLPNRTDVPGNDVVVYPFSFTIDQTPINP